MTLSIRVYGRPSGDSDEVEKSLTVGLKKSKDAKINRSVNDPQSCMVVHY